MSHTPRLARVPRRFQGLRSRDFELPSFRSQKVKFQPATVSPLLLLDIGASILFVLRERGIPCTLGFGRFVPLP
jgi:hypothetical protein